MPRKPKPPAMPGDPSDPQGMTTLMLRYLDWMQVKHYSDWTVNCRRRNIGLFIKWAEERGITRPTEVTKQVLERYEAHLLHYRQTNGKSLSPRSKHARLIPIRMWLKWLSRENHVLYNPSSEVELPRLDRRFRQLH